MLVWIRIIVSSFSLVLCIFLIAMWVRCWSHQEMIIARQDTFQTTVWNGDGVGGIIHVASDFSSYDSSLTVMNWKKEYLTPVRGTPDPGQYVWIHRSGKAAGDESIIQLPHWLVIAITGLVSFVAKPKPRWQFGLRELFFLSTIGAITLGMLAKLIQAIHS